jgi:hypothetical protein
VGGHDRHARAIPGLGLVQVTMCALHSNAAQMSQRRCIQMASERGLQATRAESGGCGDLI